jgi:hypothetical protein
MNLARTTAALAGIALAVSLSACSSSPDTAEANATWCEGAAKVETEIEKMSTLVEGGATQDVLSAQFGAVQAAIEANSVPLSQLEDAVQEDIDQAYGTFTTAVDAIPADAPASDAASAYKAAIDGFTSDIDAVKADLGCS